MTPDAPTKTPKAARRRWSLDHHGIRRQGSKTSGFHFVTAEGKRVSDEKTLARIRSLRIPPAWRNVRIARSDAAPLQAVGVDKKGRTQYLYHSRFRRQRDDEKFLRVVHFGEQLPSLRRHVRSDLSREGLDRRRVLAAITRLIDQGFFRVGNEKSAKQESTFGLTTLRPTHVHVDGSRVSFDFVGKWKKKHTRSINDPQVAKLIQDLLQVKGSELFKFNNGRGVQDVKDRHVNDYIQSVIGEHFTAKDFRTWAGTLICSIALAWQGSAETKRQQKTRIKKAIESTAKHLGNTPTVCRKSYICPRVFEEYESGRPFGTLRKKMKGSPMARVGLSIEEKALLKFLRETIADRRKAPRAA